MSNICVSKVIFLLFFMMGLWRGNFYAQRGFFMRLCEVWNEYVKDMMLQCYLLQMVCDMDEWGDSYTCKWAYVNEFMWWWHSHVYACLRPFDEMMLWSYNGLCCGMVIALLWWIMVMAEWFPHMNAMIMAGWFLHMKEKFYGWKYAQGYLRRSRDRLRTASLDL